MNRRFEDAVEIVKTHLETDKYSYSITRGHLRCYQLLRAHLTEERKTYSKHLADKWIEGVAPGLCKSTANTYRRALKKLDTAYHRNEIRSRKTQYDARQNYQNLVPWCRDLLDGFLEDMADVYERPYLQPIRISVARFLNYLNSRDVTTPEEISHRMIAAFYRDDEHGSYKSKDVYNDYIRKFLRYLSDKGVIQASVSLALDKFVLPRLVHVDDLTDNERDSFHGSGEMSLSAKTFREKTLEMNAVIEQHRYSKTVRKVFRKAWKELFVFLEANSLSYSIDTALAWANYMRKYTVQWKSFRRAMMLFEQYRECGQINPQEVFNYETNRIDLLPTWCKNDFVMFYNLKEKGGYSKSTLDMCRSSCLRLLEYLASGGVGAWDEVTPETLKEFHLKDPHSTPESKNAYSYRIRSFLEFLGEIGRVHSTLYMAIPSEAAARVSLIRTLNNAEITDICQFQYNTADALKLRYTAMILIGLRMGIRASDIAKLRFSDISWEQKTISIQQQKTGRFLKLPMPIEVGNALYRYIMQERPDAQSEYVFIAHRVPYGRMHPTACRRAIAKMLPEKSGGFHITRKTFASRMLINDVETGRIAETLGHATNQSVMTYLSTNDDKMRLCAVPLEGIPVKGGMLS